MSPPSRTRSWKAAAVSLALAGAALVAAPAVLGSSAQAAPVKIMALGDSITGSPGCWRALLWQKLQANGYTNTDFVGTLPGQGCGFDYDGENEGHGGELVTNVADQNLLPARLAATNPDVVMMHFGTNDVWSARTNTQILGAYTTLVGQMRANNPRMRIIVAQIIPVAPPSCSECQARTVTLNDAIPGWAAGLSTAQSPISVVDAWTGWDPLTDTGDGVHPNDSGIRKLAAAWYPAVVATLTGSTTSTTAPSTTRTTTSPSAGGTGFSIKDGKLYESTGAEFRFAGINHAHVWYSSQTSSFAAIKAAGANSVRVVLGGGRWGPSSASDVANVISLCKANKLICVLEDHDTTGYKEQSGATSLDDAATYWTGIASVLKGQEKYVIINIGNEPWGNQGYDGWTADTEAAIAKLRAAGLTHTLMVDAPNWGQDWSFTMQKNAPAVFASDPLANTIFSIHMYGVFDTAAEVKAYLDSFVSRGLPIVVGEFGNMHTDGDPDEDTILSYTKTVGSGMLGWSWSGNSGGVEYLDMVTGFDPTRLTSWGERFVNGTDGLKSRGVKEATVYSGTVTTPPVTTTKSSTTSTKPSTTSTKPSTSTKTTKVKTTKVKTTKVKTTKLRCKTGKNGQKTCKTTATTTTKPASTTKPSTTTTTTKATTTSSTSSAVCSAEYQVTNSWPSGFMAEVTVTPTKALSSWTVTWTFPGSETITSSWAATLTQTGRVVTATGGSVAAGTDKVFGFLADGTPSTVPTITCSGS